jgi:hypothetical protein
LPCSGIVIPENLVGHAICHRLVGFAALVRS